MRSPTRLAALLTAIALCVSAAAVVAAGPTPSPGADEDWATDRGDAGRSGSNAGEAPTGPNATVEWSRTTDHDGGPGEPTSPVVVNGTVYVGYDDVGDGGTYESRGHVLAYDAATGEVEWNRSSLPGIRTTPTVAGGLVYVTSTGDADECPDVCRDDPPDEQGGVYALDATTGEVVWARNDTDPETTPWEHADEYVVADGRVYVRTLGEVYALDAETGETVWNRTAGATALAFGNDTLVLRHGTGTNETAVHALSPETGETRWTRYLAGTPPGADLPLYAERAPRTVAVDDGTAYVSVGRDRLYAVSLEDGSDRWNVSLSASGGTPEWTSAPAVRNGSVYVGTLDVNRNGTAEVGTVRAVDAETGETDWRFETAARPVTPTVADDTVYLGAYHPSVESERTTGTTDVGVYALNATSGAERWNYVVSHRSTAQRRQSVTTAPAEGSLYVARADLHPYLQAGTVYALNSTTEATGPAERFADDDPRRAAENGTGDGRIEPNEAPTVTVSADPPNALDEPVPAGRNVTLTANASDPDGEVAVVVWDLDGDQAFERSGTSARFEADDCGIHTIHVRVIDDDGESTVKRYRVEVGG